jgi:uncharacterized membrane protein (UPF0127 family)
VKTVRIVNVSRGSVLGDRVRVADTWAGRLRGLLGRPALAPGEGLIIAPCRVVHTFGMRYPIDVVYVARDGQVVLVHDGMQPGRRGRWVRAAAWVLELPAGTARATGVAVGDRLALVPTENFFPVSSAG